MENARREWAEQNGNKKGQPVGGSLVEIVNSPGAWIGGGPYTYTHVHIASDSLRHMLMAFHFFPHINPVGFLYPFDCPDSPTSREYGDLTTQPRHFFLILAKR